MPRSPFPCPLALSRRTVRESASLEAFRVKSELQRMGFGKDHLKGGLWLDLCTYLRTTEGLCDGWAKWSTVMKKWPWFQPANWLQPAKGDVTW